MACMEHTCGDCGHMEFNNNFLLLCPKCKSTDITSHWDEQYDYDREDEDEDDEDE
jgi:Zn finger protein HypA/HybF involved in hydrogenase expression